MKGLKRDHRLGLFLELGVGLPLNLILGWGLYSRLPSLANVDVLGDRIAYALQWCTLPALVTLASIWAIALGRATSDASNPLAGRESPRMRVNLKVLGSNVEQLLLFAVASLAVATFAGPVGMQLVAVAAVMFSINRVVFWIGYLREPTLRALGITGSLYAVSALVLYAAWGSMAALAGG